MISPSTITCDALGCPDKRINRGPYVVNGARTYHLVENCISLASTIEWFVKQMDPDARTDLIKKLRNQYLQDSTPISEQETT